MAQATVNQKHRSLLSGNKKYRGRRLHNAGRLRGEVRSNTKLRIEATVNCGSNYNGPKEAKFLVG